MAEQRILILTTSYLPLTGGSELAIHEITKRLPEYKFDIVTAKFDSHSPQQEQHGNVEIFRVGNRAFLSAFLLPKNFLPLALAWRAWRLMRTRNYTAIHAYQASQAGGAVWLLKFLYPNMPFILTLQEGKNLDKQSFLMRMFRRLILRRASCITAISSFLGAYARRLTPRVRVDIIPNGVDVQKFDAQLTPSERERIRKKWDVLPEEKVIITVSRLVEKNGIADLIKAAALMKRKARLIIVGSGPLKNDLESLVRQLNMASRVIFFGTVAHEQLPEILKSADVFVRPSLSEGLGTAFLEAMVAGLPVIGTPAGGITDFIIHGETGILCVPENVQEIANAIDEVLGDSSFAERISRNGRELVRKLYTWERIASMYRNIYS